MMILSCRKNTMTLTKKLKYAGYFGLEATYLENKYISI
ncbi:Hypothetical protein BN2458_PEG1991 [Helicobacter typhlonius]|uniref:Uncharacterized protein n=1 Tax=Helicobacter typhlonius TaxID=76936 RepID=A0A0S4PYA1_9HELI|nr:Hypothetical protein BN2458_PEG1991 [Helicobacter typhlonius]